MALLEQMVSTGQLSRFVHELINKHRSDENERLLWDMWLHKVWDDTSFEDYKKRALNRALNSAKNEYLRSHPTEVAKTVERSRGIIDLFNNPVEKTK